jgi:hypothetical protein
MEQTQLPYMGEFINNPYYGTGMEPGLGFSTGSPSSLPFADAQIPGLLRQMSDESPG